MCDYCGCRSMPVIADLGDDHDRLLLLADDVRRALAAGDDGLARERLRELAVVHATHIAVEEASILPALAAVDGVADQVDEHASAGDALRRLEALSTEEVLAVLDELHDHIAREEYDLFPAALLLIAPGDWDRDEASAAAARHRAT